MRTFEKSKKLDHVAYDVRGPVVDKADEMIANNIEILKLNIGNPAVFGLHAPAEIHEALRQNLTVSEAYSNSKGLQPAREAIAEYCKTKNIQDVTPNDVYTGNGVSEMISMAMQGLLNNGDEILIPSPDYPLWTAAATLAGGVAVHYQCDESADWYPDIEDIKRKITPKTKGIVVINPNNPTGALYERALLEQIAQVARENELIVFADEIYDRLVMDGLTHTSIASIAPDVFCVTFNGLSKSHNIAGYRCGWMSLSGAKQPVRGYIEGLNMLSSMRLCANVPAQSVVAVALGGQHTTDPILQPGGRIYEQREVIVSALANTPGISVVKPKAAFYVFPKIDVKRFNIVDDEKFVLDFLLKEKVLLVHGRGFNWQQPDHFRIVYLPNVDQLRVAAQKLERFLAGYDQSKA